MAPQPHTVNFQSLLTFYSFSVQNGCISGRLSICPAMFHLQFQLPVVLGIWIKHNKNVVFNLIVYIMDIHTLSFYVIFYMVKAMPQQLASHQPINLDAHVRSYASPCGYLWLIKWHQDTLSSVIFDFPINIIPPMHHTHFFICHKAQ